MDPAVRKSEPRVRTVGFSVGGQGDSDFQGPSETVAPLPVIIPPSFQVRMVESFRQHCLL